MGSDLSRSLGMLVVPTGRDPERDQVVAAWAAANGDVTRVARFWEPPPLPNRRVRLYGNDTFCLVLAQLLDLALVSPPDDFLLHLSPRLLGRTVSAIALADAPSLSFPRFVKPMVPKAFAARVYEDAGSLAA